MRRLKICVIGIGYVGLGTGLMLSKQHEIVFVDILKEKVDKLNKGINPIKDSSIDLWLELNTNFIKATCDISECTDADMYIIAVSTDYNSENGALDCNNVTDVIKEILIYNKNPKIVIKSTVRVGYTSYITEKYGLTNVIFSPEFSREGTSLDDCLHPSRIIIGTNNKDSKFVEEYLDILYDSIFNTHAENIITGYSEAETIKLASNSYLAMRIGFFNELDTFAEINKLNAKDIIKGICLDYRIGDYYNNPSFGYGGYCLPKDINEFSCEERSDILSAIIVSNKNRKNYIANNILKKLEKTGTVGVYRLVMKKESGNFRQSSMINIIEKLKYQTDVIIYEPLLSTNEYNGCKVINDFCEFKDKSSLIIANRLDNELKEVADKVYTRDLLLNDK